MKALSDCTSPIVWAGGTSKPVAVPIGLQQPTINVPGMVSSRDVCVFSADGVFGAFWAGFDVCRCPCACCCPFVAYAECCMDHLCLWTLLQAVEGGGAGGGTRAKKRPPQIVKRQLTEHVVTRWYRPPEVILTQVCDACVLATLVYNDSS